MNAELATALKAIETQLAPIEQATIELESKLAELKSTKAKLEAAYQALSGKTHQKSKAGRKATKPCARKQDVQAVCQAVLKTSGPMTKQSLMSRVKKELSENRGFSLSGFGLRMNECLQSEAIEVAGDDVVSLRSETVQKGAADVTGDTSESCGTIARTG